MTCRPELSGLPLQGQAVLVVATTMLVLVSNVIACPV